MSKKPGLQEFVRQKANEIATTRKNSRGVPDGLADRKAIAEQARFGNIAAFGLSQQDHDRAHETSRLSLPPCNTSAPAAPAHDRYHSDLSESVTTRGKARPVTPRPVNDVIHLSSDSVGDGSDSGTDGDPQHDPEKKHHNPDPKAYSSNRFIREFYNAEESQEAQRKLNLLREERARQPASYPSTTSGVESSSPKPTLEPRTSRAKLPWTLPTAQGDSYKNDYMKKSASNYQKHHQAQPNLAQKRVVTEAGPQTPEQPAGAPGSTSSSPSAHRGLPERNLSRKDIDQYHLAELATTLNSPLPVASAAGITSRPAKSTPDTNIDANNTSEAPLDYDAIALRSKAFNDLRSEDFNFDPAATDDPPIYPSDVNDGSFTKAYQEYDLRLQTIFCKQVPAKDWPKVDTWFAAEVGRIAAQRTQKREERRDIARRFEQEAGARYDAVAGEIEDMGGKLRELKATGGAMLRKGSPKRKR